MRSTSQVEWGEASRSRRHHLPSFDFARGSAALQPALPVKHVAISAIFICVFALLVVSAAMMSAGATSVSSRVLGGHLGCAAILIALVVLRSTNRPRGDSGRLSSRAGALPAEAGAAATASRRVEHEIAARKTAEQEAAENTRRVKELMIRTNTVTVLIASDTTILDGNEALPQLLGRTALDDLVGKGLSAVLELEDEGAAQYFCNETLRLGTFACDLEAMSPGGGVVWIEATGAASVFNGRPCVMAILRDISDRKVAEMELRRSCQALSGALEVARTSNETKSAFVAKMNHELRTPLNGIIGLSEMLRHTASDRNVPGAEIRRFCEHIHRSGTHLLSLVEDLLDLSRLEAGTWSLNPAAVDITVELNSALVTLVPIAHKRRIAVENSCPPSFKWVLDQRAFRQIIINLATNAVKFSPSDGRVRIAVTRSDAEMTLHVADEGPGIPAQELERIAMPFGRGSYAVDHRIDGVGLGLPIVSELLRLHGGKLTIESELGRGSTFAATFPSGLRPANSFRLAAE